MRRDTRGRNDVSGQDQTLAWTNDVTLSDEHSKLSLSAATALSARIDHINAVDGRHCYTEPGWFEESQGGEGV